MKLFILFDHQQQVKNRLLLQYVSSYFTNPVWFHWHLSEIELNNNHMWHSAMINNIIKLQQQRPLRESQVRISYLILNNIWAV